MSARGLAVCWLLAVALVTSVFTALAIRIGSPMTALPDAGNTPVVAIGSSLTRHAVPVDAPPGGLLGDGRAHLRWDISSISEAQTLELFDRAIDAGVDTIIIEANPLAFDFGTARPQSRFASAVLNPWLDMSDRVRRWLKAQVTSTHGVSDADRLNRQLRIDPALLEAIYPLKLRAPREAGRLSELIAEAEAGGLEVIFWAPPRAGITTRYLDSEELGDLERHFVELARTYGVGLLSSGGIWPDDHFVDHAHMNARGRDRFVLELQAWWKEHHVR